MPYETSPRFFPHYLLRVNATEVILANDRDDQCAAIMGLSRAWEKRPWSSVRRGASDAGSDSRWYPGNRNAHRGWAALCPPSAIQQIITPHGLAKAVRNKQEIRTPSLACRAPGIAGGVELAGGSRHHSAGDRVGSVGFRNSQQGKRTTIARSDLDNRSFMRTSIYPGAMLSDSSSPPRGS